MIDYSFLRLKDNITDALNIGDSPVTTHYYFNPIQILPNKTYTQITNIDGGIAITSECEVFIIDCDDNVLADITDNVFFSEFTDIKGQNQLAFEIVNLGVDFYRTTVLLKFKQLASDAVYYSNPINITAYQSERTVFFKYKNYDDFNGIGYTAANLWQSISLSMYFDIPIDETETEDYFQISRNNTISARALQKVFEQYAIEQINAFTFVRLNSLLKHELIYLDDLRVTNKPTVSSTEREGDSNFMVTDVTVAKNYNDVSPYQFQIADANLQIINILPLGNYTSSTIELDAKVDFNNDITINTGFVRVFDASDDSLVLTFTEADMQVLLGNQLYIEGFLIPMIPNGSYYVTMSAGLISSTLFGTLFEGINDNSTWTFNLSAGDYAIEDYNSVDYFVTNPPEPNPIIDNLSLFYKFNETSGTTAIDASTFDNNGNIVNALIDQVGLIDKCYSFNNGATNQYVEIPDADSLSFGAGAFSVEVWVNPSANFGRILNKYNVTTGDLEYRLFLQSGVLQFFIYTDANNRIGIADNVVLSIGAWHQIVVTYNGSGTATGLKMKVDNNVASFAPQLTGTYTGMPNTSQPVILSQQSDNLTGSNRYSGLMDILRIWKGYALSDLEITTLYNSGNGTEIL